MVAFRQACGLSPLVKEMLKSRHSEDSSLAAAFSSRVGIPSSSAHFLSSRALRCRHTSSGVVVKVLRDELMTGLQLIRGMAWSGFPTEF